MIIFSTYQVELTGEDEAKEDSDGELRVESKSFGTNITENHFGNLSALFFGQALDQMGQKCRYLAQNASFGPNLAVFGPKIQGFGGME